MIEHLQCCLVSPEIVNGLTYLLFCNAVIYLLVKNNSPIIDLVNIVIIYGISFIRMIIYFNYFRYCSIFIFSSRKIFIKFSRVVLPLYFDLQVASNQGMSFGLVNRNMSGLHYITLW